LNLRLIPRDEYFTGLLYETGSGEFNHEMRKAAHSKGFTKILKLDLNRKAIKIYSNIIKVLS
jgi:DNA polymerase/3'-5' exonuclease PolX